MQHHLQLHLWLALRRDLLGCRKRDVTLSRQHEDRATPTLDVCIAVGHRHRVPMLGHPGQSLVHHVEGAVALLVPHLAHLEQHILAAGGHRVLLSLAALSSARLSSTSSSSTVAVRSH